MNSSGQDRKSNESFKPPFIIQSLNPDSIKAWDTEGINEVWPEFVGQYKFSDTVRIGEREIRSVTEDELKWEFDENNFRFDTLSSDGLQIYPDYSTTIIQEWYPGSTEFRTSFPLYIVNETKDAKLFIGKDSWGFAIQEAFDTSGYNSWYAIEAKGYDFCGNGFFRRKLRPGEFIMILMPKYDGTETTYIRTRVKIGGNIFISKPYKGLISRKQFTIQKSSWFAEGARLESSHWIFYGARYKE